MNCGVYPIIDPPEHLRGHGRPRNWSEQIAQEHFDWFTGILEERIRTLLGFFEASSPSRGGEHRFLLDLGAAVSERLSTEPNFRELSGKIELTAPGLSMAHDMGIMVAQLIVDSADGTVRWQLLKEPRRALEFNMPVLVGRVPTLILDPIRGSLTEAKAILRGAELSDIWARTYDFWLERFTSDKVLQARRASLPN